jgi:MraZ protein
MFTGEYKHSVDKKGRSSVPAEMREVLKTEYDERFVVTKSLLGTCLWAFPYTEWKKLADKIGESGIGSRQLIRLKRKLFPAARTCPVDKAGRILIPEPLRQYAGIEGDCIFASAGRYVEIWRPDLWEEELLAVDDDASTDAILDTMVDLGL